MVHAERPGEVPAETLSDVAVGVDGCRGGWLAVGRVRGRLVHAVFPTFQALMAGRGRDDRVYIDMPIGLPGRANPTRECDRMARRFLAGRRSASVFPPPCRAAVHAPDLASARRLNLASLGRSLSAQSWNIAPRIREVDNWLRAHAGWSRTVRESHPEVAFRALGGAAPTHSKRKSAGIEERLALLAACERDAPAFYRRALAVTARADVARDDILDATVLWLVAMAPVGALKSLPDPAPEDEAGLPCAICYRDGCHLP